MRAFLVVLLLAGCSGGSDELDMGDLGVGDGGDDLSVYMSSHDAGPLVCGAAGVCGSGTGCCVEPLPDGGAEPHCEGSCVAPGVPISCAGPGHCDGKPCCITLANSKATQVMCTAEQTDCVPTANIMGNGVTRVCDVDEDCTAGAPDTMFNQCCHLVQLGYHICFSAAYVPITKGQIACP